MLSPLIMNPQFTQANSVQQLNEEKILKKEEMESRLA
jgi:hypothetical protein